jgi:hypothetical protein
MWQRWSNRERWEQTKTAFMKNFKKLIAFRKLFLPRSSEYSVFYHTSNNLNIKLFKTITLYVVLYGCGSWSYILRQISPTKRQLRAAFKRSDSSGGGGCHVDGGNHYCLHFTNHKLNIKKFFFPLLAHTHAQTWISSKRISMSQTWNGGLQVTIWYTSAAQNLLTPRHFEVHVLYISRSRVACGPRSACFTYLPWGKNINWGNLRSKS